nr:hypothetical protein [Tanacetum cinerariifolium]
GYVVIAAVVGVVSAVAAMEVRGFEWGRYGGEVDVVVPCYGGEGGVGSNDVGCGMGMKVMMVVRLKVVIRVAWCGGYAVEVDVGSGS